MQIFFYVITFVFLFINIKIVFSDIKEKKIPNEGLLYLILLLPSYYLYLYLSPIYTGIDYQNFLIQFGLTFLISFALYYYGVWSAGDAKYILVLSLFLPVIGIVPLVGNIALLTLAYLIAFFIYFFFVKSLFIKNIRNMIFFHIHNNSKILFQKLFLKGDTSPFSKQFFKNILNWLVTFLIIFVAIRLSRIYIVNDLLNEVTKYEFFSTYLSYIFLASIILFIGLIYLITKVYLSLRQYILFQKYGIYNHTTDIVFLFWISLVLIYFISTEYQAHPYEMMKNMKLILSYYIVLWIVIKILYHSYKLIFQLTEQYFIKIQDLQAGEIVNKKWLAQTFGTSRVLGAEDNTQGLLYPNPIKYFSQIENPIDDDTVTDIKEIYNTLQREKEAADESFKQNYEIIGVIKTFVFGSYIFLAFLITFIYSDSFLQSFLYFLLKHYLIITG